MSEYRLCWRLRAVAFRVNPMNVFVALRVTRAAEGLPRRRFTVAEVEAMVEAGFSMKTSASN